MAENLIISDAEGERLAFSQVKFLAAEALRGVGGVLIDREGKRFANELGRRDYVTGRMWKNKPPFRLCLNSKASKEIHWHCEHYKGRGVMKSYESGLDLAKEMGIPESVLRQTFDDHTALGEKQASDPDGGKYDASPIYHFRCFLIFMLSKFG